MAASGAHSGRTSDCGAAWVGIVYVCALVFHSRCKRGLPRRIRLSVHGVKGLGLLHRRVICHDPVAGETEEGDK